MYARTHTSLDICCIFPVSFRHTRDKKIVFALQLLLYAYNYHRCKCCSSVYRSSQTAVGNRPIRFTRETPRGRIPYNIMCVRWNVCLTNFYKTKLSSLVTDFFFWRHENTLIKKKLCIQRIDFVLRFYNLTIII